jgi:hypothetical protein
MLSGAALATATAVSFGGAAAAFSVSSDSTVWATAPAGTGTVGVGVTTLGGTSATVSYRYVPLPSVTGVTPAAGPLAGVASVTLTGTYFTEASQVSFGTVSGAFTVSSDSCIVATAPAASAGAVTVYVTTPYGVNASSPPFTYLAPPVITQLYPGNSGPVTGQDYLQLFGSNFTSDSVVTLAGVVVPNQFLGTTSVAINNYPPGDVGTVPVTLTTPGGSSTQNFTYVPIVTGIAPAAGPLAGGGAVVVTGSGFTAASTVTLGTATVSALSASGGTSLTALAPAGTGTVLVNVTTSGFVSDNTTVTYEYVPPPVIETVSASFGPITGGQTVSLYGTGLSYVTAASFGGVARTPTVVSDSLLTLAAPTTSSFGPTPITVSSVGGTASGTYTYAPTVAAVAPAYGPSAGGQLVTVAGTGFTASSTLRIGGAAATGLVCTVSNSLQAVTPAGAKGAAAVTVTTSGVASQDPVTYQYYVAPTITAITPASGPILGGQLVTVSGTEFAPGLTTVTLGGKNATPSGVTETGLTFTTPSGASIGAATLAVTTPGGTASGTYTYVPSVAVVTPGYGPLSGGTAITISGGGFGAGSTVTIGGRAATSVSYVNPSQISAVTPSGAVGPASVLVTTSGLTSASNSLFAFEPEVTSVLPIGGTDDGGTLVTLTGTGFTGATAVAFGDVAATLVTVTSDTQLTAVSPSALTDDTVPVSVTVSGIISTVAAPYTYAPSVMTDLVFLELTPTPSYLGNGYWISGTDYFITLYSLYITWENANEVLNSFVTGSGVVGTATVLNNVQWYIPANTLLTMVWEPMLIYYRTPRPGYPNYAELSLYSVVRVDGNVYPYALTVGANLFNDGTMTSTRHLPAVQPYILGGDAPPPTVAAVTPPTGKATGGDTITVSGTGFLESSTVTVGGAAATDVVFISEDALTATTPAGALGAASVVVTTTGQSSAPNALYTYHPAVTAVTPGTGSVDGGTIITITGAGFSAASTVTVAGAPATGVAYDTGVLTAQTPASAFGPASVVVTTSGLSSAANTLYTYVPTVTGVTPASGPAGGGELISVSGSGFNAGTVLTVGGAPATGVVYISESALTGITPAGGVGAASVVVTTGAYSSEANSLYAYNPSVAGVTPASGTVTGGTLITISGSGFSAGSTVTVGGASASGVAYSAGALTARTPAGAAGAASVLVTTSGRVSAPNSFYQYVITPPTLQSVTPSVGAQSGGQLVTLSGTHFTGASAITFDGSPGVIVSVPSDSQLTATTPAGATAGAVSVLLTTPNGPNPANTLYTYDPALNPPTGLNGTTAGVSYGPPYGVWTIYENIVSWDANGGSVSGYHLVIDAAGYASPSVLFSGDVGNVTSYTQKLIASAGPPLGYATLTLYSINSQGVSGSLATVGNVPVQLIYTSGPAPVITGLHPPTGPLTGGQALTVCGQNLAGATTALFANSQVAAVYNADGTVSVTTPAAAAGAVPVVVNAEGGPSAVNSTYYTYYAPPTVSSISPIAGPATAGTLVTLTGTNFTGLTGVTFGGRPGASPTFLDDSSITVLAPSGPLGSAAVVVSTYSGSGATTYIYDGPPTFTGITPAKGVSIGGTPVTISGDYLAATTSVTFNGAAGTITGVTDTALTVITPAGSGPAVVGIQSTAGAAYSASGAYTYYGPDYNPPTNVTLTRLFGPYGNQVSWTPAEGSSPSAIDYYDVTITSTFGMAIFSASGPGYITSIPQYIPSVSGSTQAVARVTAVLTNGDSGATGNSPVSQAFYYTP